MAKFIKLRCRLPSCFGFRRLDYEIYYWNINTIQHAFFDKEEFCIGDPGAEMEIHPDDVSIAIKALEERIAK